MRDGRIINDVSKKPKVLTLNIMPPDLPSGTSLRLVGDRVKYPCIDIERVLCDERGMVTHLGGQRGTGRLTENPMQVDDDGLFICCVRDIDSEKDMYHNTMGNRDNDESFMALGATVCKMCAEYLRDKYKQKSDSVILKTVEYGLAPIEKYDLGIFKTKTFYTVCAMIFAYDFAPFLNEDVFSLSELQKIAFRLSMASTHYRVLHENWGFSKETNEDIMRLNKTRRQLFHCGVTKFREDIHDMDPWGIVSERGHLFVGMLRDLVKRLETCIVYNHDRFSHTSVFMESIVQSFSEDTPKKIAVVALDYFKASDIGVCTVPLLAIETLKKDDVFYDVIIIYAANLLAKRHWDVIMNVFPTSQLVAVGNQNAIPPLHVGNVFRQLCIVKPCSAWKFPEPKISSNAGILMSAAENRDSTAIQQYRVAAYSINLNDLGCGPFKRKRLGIVCSHNLTWDHIYYLAFFCTLKERPILLGYKEPSKNRVHDISILF